jgi:pullulanase
MKILTLLALAILTMRASFSQQYYSKYPAYNGTDLGLTYSNSHSVFKIWSPPAEAAELLLYKKGTGGKAIKKVSMAKGEKGTWLTKLAGNHKGRFYTFKVKINGQWSNEVPDPYTKATGVNGKRAMVVNLAETNPSGWLADKSSAFSATNNKTDAIIYELHIRDASIAENSGIKNKGKYLGLAEEGTKNSDGLSTGLDHIKQLGVTHIHLLPFFDYNSVDESRPDVKQYNWGYDPLNYNVPEGSYSTNPYDGKTRIKELKKMIKAFHKNGMRVVMDVVYNHVADAQSSSFNQLVPGYYFRHKKDGTFSDATACGNETASEMPMMRKFMLESLLYWVKEYHIDGFRFDLMGVHDIKTMNQIAAALHKVKPDILLYGEGWTAGDSPLPDSLRALKKNAAKLDRIAVFSDDVRDGIKGSVFDINDRGFASGKAGMEETIKFGITAASNHPQVDFTKVNYSKKAYSAAPWNVITYCECHDNNILIDKLRLSCKDASKEELEKMQQLALTIVLTSQGIPFLHAGTEFLRSKNGVENSYNAGDSINQIDWSLKSENLSFNKYIQQLIAIRKAHPAFRMMTNELVLKNIRFDQNAVPGTIMYTINGAATKDSWKKIMVAFNGTNQAQTFASPAGSWRTAVNTSNDEITTTGRLKLDKFSAVILYQD